MAQYSRGICPQLQEVYKRENWMIRNKLYLKWFTYYHRPFGANVACYQITEKSFRESDGYPLGPRTEFKMVWIDHYEVFNFTKNFEVMHDLVRDYY